jgi:anti-sigma regulatory factor (Ser/Thr protein kinase)
MAEQHCGRGERTTAVTIVYVPSSPASAATVRQHLAADLTDAHVPTSVVEDAVLIASELISNAIRHAHTLPDGTLAVAWEVDGQGVTVRVTDGGSPGQPRMRHAGPEETSGRGLVLVQALAADWGIEDDGSATTVWAQLRA